MHILIYVKEVMIVYGEYNLILTCSCNRDS